MSLDKLLWYAEYMLDTWFGLIRCDGTYCKAFDKMVNDAIEADSIYIERTDGVVYDVRLDKDSLIGVWVENRWYGYGRKTQYEQVVIMAESGGVEDTHMLYQGTTNDRVSVATMYKLQKYLKDHHIKE